VDVFPPEPLSPVAGLGGRGHVSLQGDVLLLPSSAASIMQSVAFVWPVIALFVTTGLTWWLNLTIIAAIAVIYIDNAPFHGLKRWQWIGFPLTSILFQYIIWNATVKTLVHSGIDWRGTHYSLAELKANRL
jgi:hypothetical protein